MSSEPKEPIELSLGSKNQAEEAVEVVHHDVHHAPPAKSSVVGWIAVICGILGLFTLSIVFVPLGLLFSFIAIFSGQILWGLFGIVLALLGFLTSPTLLGIVGLAALAAYFGL